MDDADSPAKPTVDDLLLMATQLHGCRDSQVRGNEHITANGFKILKQTLIWLDKWSDASFGALVGDGPETIALSLYQSLIDLSRPDNDNRLIVGFGNLHEDPDRRSHPVYVAFGATARGREVAVQLFHRYDGYSPFNPTKTGPSSKHA